MKENLKNKQSKRKREEERKRKIERKKESIKFRFSKNMVRIKPRRTRRVDRKTSFMKKKQMRVLTAEIDNEQLVQEVHSKSHVQMMSIQCWKMRLEIRKNSYTNSRR